MPPRSPSCATCTPGPTRAEPAPRPGPSAAPRPGSAHFPPRPGGSRCRLERMSNRSDVVELLDRCAASLHPEHVRPLLGQVLDQATAGRVATTFAMLADPTRARIVHALSLADELCVCDLALLLGVSQSAMSHQLRLLRDHHVVARRRAGRVAYYRLADGHIRHIFADGTRHTLEGRD